MFRGLLMSVALLCGCSMLSHWQAIPPPGGCDQCHRVPIAHNWELVYQPVMLSNESGAYPWQQPSALLEDLPSEGPARQKITEARCFDCHQSPDREHLERTGRYQH